MVSGEISYPQGQTETAGISGYLINEKKDELVRLYEEQPENAVIKVSLADLQDYINRVDDLSDSEKNDLKGIYEEVRFMVHHIWRLSCWKEITGIDAESPVVYDDGTPKSSPIPVDTHVAFIDAPVTVPVGDDLSDRMGEIVAVDGIVRHVSSPVGRIRFAVFRCNNCLYGIRRPVEGRFRKPNPLHVGECPDCESNSWKLDLESSVIDKYQQIRLQEPPEGSTTERPREVDIDVVGSGLIDKCAVGDRVSIIGVVRAEPAKKTNLVEAWLDGISVIPRDNKFSEEDISDEDRELIDSIAARDDLWTFNQICRPAGVRVRRC